MDDKEAVRKACLRDGKSQRAVSREFGMARNTVSKLLKDPHPPRYRLGKVKSRPVLGDYQEIIHTWLSEDEAAPRKQQHTAKRIYDRLVAEHGFGGSERTIRQYVAEIRQKAPEGFVPLAFQPGEMAQADWIEKMRVILAGTLCTVDVLGLVLNHCGSFHFEAFEHMKQEAFFTGHVHAFEFWGGVPRTITYDNLKAAVTKVLTGKNRLENERFAAFRSAFLFDSRFCQPGKGNEKGRIENMVKFVERNLFTPIPRVDSLAELNALLKERCEAYLTHTQARQSQTVGERLQAEQAHFLPLPERMPECCRIVPVKANRFAMIQFETNRYSVPSEYAYQALWVKAFVGRVEVTTQSQLIATHSRLKGRFQESIQAEHYQKLLERKPGAKDHFRGNRDNAAALPSGALHQTPMPPPAARLSIQKPNLSKYSQLRRNSPYELTPNLAAGCVSEAAPPAQYTQAVP